MDRSVNQFPFISKLNSDMSVGFESMLIPRQGCLFSIWGNGGPLEETVDLDMEAMA